MIVNGQSDLPFPWNRYEEGLVVQRERARSYALVDKAAQLAFNEYDQCVVELNMRFAEDD
jgi:hypothetical protein